MFFGFRFLFFRFIYFLMSYKIRFKGILKLRVVRNRCMKGDGLILVIFGWVFVVLWFILLSIVFLFVMGNNDIDFVRYY